MKTEMKIKHIPYPKIKQYKDIVSSVIREATFVGVDEDGNAIYDTEMVRPTLKVHGTVKMHGTNAGVSYNNNHGLYSQSRNNAFTLDKTISHMGFTAFVKYNEDVWVDMMKSLAKTHKIDLDKNIITIFMEWVGKGIQKNVAVSKMDKTAIIFSHAKVTPLDGDLDGFWIPTKVN